MRIPLADIRYLDVRRNYVTVHADRDYTVKRPLGEFEAELGDGFCRVGRAMIVNLRRIRCVGRSSGNAMADVILSSKMSLAQAHGIDVRVDAHIPIKLRISELDLCCVFGNLFDNAIEANDGLPEADRMIRVYMDMKGTQLYISFTNASSGGKQRKVGGRFRTTKSDEGHGFGLVHIDQIIEAAGGYLSRNFEDGAFTTEILLPQS